MQQFAMTKVPCLPRFSFRTSGCLAAPNPLVKLRRSHKPVVQVPVGTGIYNVHALLKAGWRQEILSRVSLRLIACALLQNVRGHLPKLTM